MKTFRRNILKTLQVHRPTRPDIGTPMSSNLHKQIPNWNETMTKPNSETTVSYFIIDFTGKPHAHDLYTRLLKYCWDASEWMHAQGRKQDSLTIRDWISSRGGFVRAHTPYYVTLSTDEWKLLSEGLRAGQGTPPAYTFARTHGYRWHRPGPRT